MDADADAEPLAEISILRHRDLAGRAWEPRTRFVLVCLLLVFVALAAGNALGQQPSRFTAANPAATIAVSTPERVRGGLIFQTRVDVSARTTIQKPTLVLDGGWFDGMTLNSTQPGPATQAARGSAVTFAYPRLAAGARMSVWFEWSVNPTNLAWSRPEVLRLDDGTRPILTVSPSVTVLP
jgi:hypothetical protein